MKWKLTQIIHISMDYDNFIHPLRLWVWINFTKNLYDFENDLFSWFSFGWSGWRLLGIIVVIVDFSAASIHIVSGIFLFLALWCIGVFVCFFTVVTTFCYSNQKQTKNPFLLRLVPIWMFERRKQYSI